MIRARLIYRSRNGTTPLKGEHRLDGAPAAGVGGRPRTMMQRRPALPRRKYMARVTLDNYSLDCYPRFGRIPPPLPSSSVPRPAATPRRGRGQPALPKTMRLGVREREQLRGCERAGSNPLFPVSGPKAYVHAGGRLVSEFLRAQNPKGHGWAPCRGLGHGSGEPHWRCGSF